MGCLLSSMIFPEKLFRLVDGGAGHHRHRHIITIYKQSLKIFETFYYLNGKLLYIYSHLLPPPITPSTGCSDVFEKFVLIILWCLESHRGTMDRISGKCITICHIFLFFWVTAVSSSVSIRAFLYYDLFVFLSSLQYYTLCAQ